jgi:hypothetical protein
LRDYTHASKTFRSNSYAYAPKFKHLFHVYFNINSAFTDVDKNWPEDANFGLTVKTVQLPKYGFDLTTLNQYNRKRIIQTKIKYDPIQITFHDDNNNLVRKLWHSYYTYYYKDAAQVDLDVFNSRQNGAVGPPAAKGGKVYDNNRNIYEPSIRGNDDWGYIGEGNQHSAGSSSLPGKVKIPFFRSIDIYGFNQHNFAMYRLINPIIETFGHDTYSYSENGIMENTMQLQFETVKYYDGAIDGRVPGDIVKNFGNDATYDRTLSPIARPGSNASILGQGGLVDAAGGIMNDIASGNYVGAMQKAGAAAQTFKNPANILNIAKGEALGMATDAISGTPNRNNQFNFPAAVSSGTQSINNAIGSVANRFGSKPTSPANVPSKDDGESNIGNHCACRGAFLFSSETIISLISIFVWNAVAADS